MVNHEFLGSQPGDNTTRYFIRKGSQQEELAQDLEAAKGYKWNVRVQGQEGLSSKSSFKKSYAYGWTTC